MNTTPIRIIPIALVLALAACQQHPKPAAPVQAPAATQQASPSAAAKAEAPAPKAEVAAPVAPKPSQPAATRPSATTAKAAAPRQPAKSSEPATAAATPVPVKPAATMPEAPKPAPAVAVAAKPAAPAKAAPTAPFSTIRCMACHAIDHDKVGPAWKTVVEKYGDEAALAKDFETGFKQRRVANSIAKWKSKEGLMSSQFDHLIKGHAKAAAHALFMTVKNGKFGTY